MATKRKAGRLRRPRKPSRGARLLTEWCADNGLSQNAAANTLGLTDGRHFAKLLSGEVGAGLEVAMRIQAATNSKVPASAWLEYEATTVEMGRKAS